MGKGTGNVLFNTVKFDFDPDLKNDINDYFIITIAPTLPYHFKPLQPELHNVKVMRCR